MVSILIRVKLRVNMTALFRLSKIWCKDHWMKGDDLGNADSVFAYDASFDSMVLHFNVTERKKARRRKLARHFLSSGIPIIGQIETPGTARQAIHFGLMKILCL